MQFYIRIDYIGIIIKSMARWINYLIIIIMGHSFVGRIGRVLLPIIIKVVIIPIVPIGTIPLRWSIIVINWLKILIKWFTLLFKSRVDYISSPIISRIAHIIIITIENLWITKIAISRRALEIIP